MMRTRASLGAFLAIALLPGCSTTRHVQPLTDDSRARISTLALTVIHDLQPSIHSPLLEMSQSASGTSYRIVGYRSWTIERYTAAAELVGTRLGDAVVKLQPGHLEALARARLDPLDQLSTRFTILPATAGSAAPDTVAATATATLQLRLYYKTRPDNAYAGLRAQIHDAAGTKLYDRIEFSSNWTPADFEADLPAKLAAFADLAIPRFWSDLVR